MPKQKPSPEQLERERVLMIKNTLDSKLFRDTVGSNFGQTNPTLVGQWGMQGVVPAYDGVTSSDEFQRMRMAGYNESRDSMRQANIYGEPSMPTNGDVSYKIAQSVERAKSEATLGELAKYCKTYGADFGVIPEKIAGMTQSKLVEKALTDEGELDLKRLSKDEQNALALHQTLSQAFTRACTLRVADFYADLRNQAQKIQEGYKPKEPKKK